MFLCKKPKADILLSDRYEVEEGGRARKRVCVHVLCVFFFLLRVYRGRHAPWDIMSSIELQEEAYYLQPWFKLGSQVCHICWL